MTVKKHNGSYTNGTVVGYTSYSGKELYSYKLVKEVYVEATGDYRWIAQYGKVKLSENKFVPDNDGQTFYVFSDKEIKDGYPEVWTKDPEFVKGDILEGKTSSGKRVVLLYVSNQHVERLTPLDEQYSGEKGWGSLAHYQGELTDIKALTTSLTSARFSAL
jgi:hypothetical protein